MEDDQYQPPMGPRFSQLYIERGPAVSESKRLRNRVAAYFRNDLDNYGWRCSPALQKRIGVEGYLGSSGSEIAEYLRKCTPADFYDAITVIFETVRTVENQDRHSFGSPQSDAWKAFCQNAFVEENVAYRVDGRCLIHPLVDDEFQRNHVALLRGLQGQSLRAVKSEVERAVDRLGGRESDPKEAVRSIFEALEIYAKLAVKTCVVTRLNRNIVMEHMLPALVKARNLDEPAAKAAMHIAESVVDWLAACHIYRHGQGVTEPAPPPPELAVSLVSNGLAHLRWFLDSLPIKSD